MPRSTQSSYKGYRITTRWNELGPLADPKAKRFDASFTVDPATPDEESWQQFPRQDFDNFLAAVANALTLAERSIDLNLAAV